MVLLITQLPATSCLPLALAEQERCMVCPESGFRYQLVDQKTVRCLDLDEESPLPADKVFGKKPYDEFKKS